MKIFHNITNKFFITILTILILPPNENTHPISASNVTYVITKLSQAHLFLTIRRLITRNKFDSHSLYLKTSLNKRMHTLNGNIQEIFIKKGLKVIQINSGNGGWPKTDIEISKQMEDENADVCVVSESNFDPNCENTKERRENLYLKLENY